MNRRLSALCLALAAAATSVPAAAQGLRSTPLLSMPRAPSGPRAADFIVAIVNSEPITNNEVRMRMARFEQQLAQQGQAVPPRAEFARQVLERLISEKAQLQYAKEANVKIDDAVVQQAEQNLARQNGMTVPEFRSRMTAEGMDPAGFREELRNQLLLTRVREREFENRIRVTDAEAEQFLREQQQAAQDPARQELNLAHILVSVPENATEAQVAAQRDKAQRALAQARAGEDFAKIAREFSDAQQAGANGMPVGPRSPDRLPPLFVQAVAKLPEGGVSDIVRSQAGFHLIKLVERQRGGLPTVAVQTHARHILLRPGPQQTEAQAVQRLADFKRRVQAGQAEFAQLAREFSQDASAANGGDLGWAAPGMFVPEFEEAMSGLQPGQIADPVVSRFGVHLIQVLERRKTELTQKDLREMARAALRERKLDESYASWAQEVRGRAYIEYRDPPA